METRIASTPPPPYYAVIFSSHRKDVDDGYYAMNARLTELIRDEHPDYLGIESYREASGHGVSIVYFRTYEAIMKWREQPEHMVAKERGKSEWYHHYNIRIARVEHEYGSFHPAMRSAGEETVHNK